MRSEISECLTKNNVACTRRRRRKGEKKEEGGKRERRKGRGGSKIKCNLNDRRIRCDCKYLIQPRAHFAGVEIHTRVGYTSEKTPKRGPSVSLVGCVACCVASGAFPPTRRPIRADARKTYSTAGRTAVHVPQKKPKPSHPPENVCHDGSGSWCNGAVLSAL